MVGKGSDIDSPAQEALMGDSSSSSTPTPSISLGKGSDHRTIPDIKNEPSAATVNNAPNMANATADTPTPTPTAPSLQWGNVYKTPGDMPVGKQVFILPKKDYRHTCYMWQVPNGEVVIPGKPLYYLPSEKTILNSAFGFMDSDVLEDFGVLAVDSCSDWKKYAKERETGGWDKMKESLLGPASKKTDTAATPAPAATKKAKKTDK